MTFPLETLRTLLAVTIVASLIALGCANSATTRIIIPVRTCALEGSALAGMSQDDRNSAVFALFGDVNQKVWSAANLGFLACCQDVPVVKDTVVWRTGVLGWVARSSGFDSQEMTDEGAECAAAWAAKTSSTGGGGFTDGPIVILVVDISQQDVSQGSEDNDLQDVGDTSPQLTSPKLCVEPRVLTAADVSGRLTFSIEPGNLSAKPIWPQQFGVGWITLAHELGHQLLLFHGDGLDNDHNGLEPPTPGLRLFDQKCDPPEHSVGFNSEAGSLMDFENTELNYNLTSWQIELAREGAEVFPGHVDVGSSSS